MRKFEYILRRILFSVLVIISVSIITFIIARIVPSDPAILWVGPRATNQQIEQARIELGLSDPIHIQYIHYVGGLLHGDFGISLKTHQPIIRDIQVRLPSTMELVFVSMLIAISFGIPLGVLSGAKPGSPLDHTTRLLAIAGVSMPSFLMGLFLQLVFFGEFGLLPLGGRVSRNITLYNPVEHITGFNIIDTILTSNYEALTDNLIHLILPAFTLAAFSIGLSIRMTRSTMIEVLQEKYIVAARAAGLKNNTILFRLALKNAIIPTITVLGLAFVYALTGAIIVEVIFSWPGLGTYITDAVLSVDFPVIMAVTLISTIFYVLVNLILDLIQAFLDPRISLG